MRATAVFLQGRGRFFIEQSGYCSDNYFQCPMRESRRLHEEEERISIEVYGWLGIFVFSTESTGDGRLGQQNFIPCETATKSATLKLRRVSKGL